MHVRVPVVDNHVGMGVGVLLVGLWGVGVWWVLLCGLWGL